MNLDLVHYLLDFSLQIGDFGVRLGSKDQQVCVCVCVCVCQLDCCESVCCLNGLPDLVSLFCSDFYACCDP